MNKAYSLEQWETDWQMAFHPEKCEVIHITTKRAPILHKYTLHDHTLCSVPQIKYLGVQLSQDPYRLNFLQIE